MHIDRRSLLKAGLALASIGQLASRSAQAAAPEIATRLVPATGERLPIVGLGSWITFNVGDDTRLRDESTRVISAFIEGGGRMIDSSPMYGSSQATIGYALAKLGHPKAVYATDKVWTSSGTNGPRQIEQTRRQWGIERFDLLQVHNLVNWQDHLETLRAMKADGRLGAIGITTSHGSRHERLEQVMRHEAIDFVQLTYNILDRAAERRLLPLAKEKGLGVIVNRPYRRGALLRRVERHPLPKWVAETGAGSWAQFLLKYAISHPAVTCAIPATTRVDHVRENLAAGAGMLPDARLRKRMQDYVGQL